MKNNLKEIELVFNSISDIVFFIRETNNGDYFITFSNKVFKRIIKSNKYANEDIELHSALSKDNCTILLNAFKSIEVKKEIVINEIAFEVDNKMQYYEATIKDINEDLLDKYYLVSCRDISNRKKYEEQIRRIQNEAEESSKLKDSLLLNINHEFRTPLHGILGISELLIEESNDDYQKQMLKRIANSGRRLLNTLISIIELSRLESLDKKVYTTKVTLSEIIISVVEKYRSEAEHKGLALECNISDSKLAAHVDESFFRLVITNLIDNAIKFTKKGSVTVSLSKDISINGNAIIQITDTGIGISKKNLDKIFNAFIQESEGVGRSHEGIGVGLTLVRRMTKMMGGEVSVETEKNIGSTFTLNFPSISDDKTQYTFESLRSKTRLSANGYEMPHILIVEDNEMSRTLTKTFLNGKYLVDTAESGLEALDHINKKSYSVVLMDINLGSGMNGLDLLNEIRNRENYINVPIIAMTGYAFNSDKENFIKCGFSNHIAKPFNKQQLLNMLEEVLTVSI